MYQYLRDLFSQLRIFTDQLLTFPIFRQQDLQHQLFASYLQHVTNEALLLSHPVKEKSNFDVMVRTNKLL